MDERAPFELKLVNHRQCQYEWEQSGNDGAEIANQHALPGADTFLRPGRSVMLRTESKHSPSAILGMELGYRCVTRSVHACREAAPAIIVHDGPELIAGLANGAVYVGGVRAVNQHDAKAAA